LAGRNPSDGNCFLFSAAAHVHTCSFGAGAFICVLSEAKLNEFQREYVYTQCSKVRSANFDLKVASSRTLAVFLSQQWPCTSGTKLLLQKVFIRDR
jgi:hypothetical protein